MLVWFCNWDKCYGLLRLLLFKRNVFEEAVVLALQRLPPLCTKVVVRPKLPVATCWLPIKETPPMLVWLAAALAA